MVPHLRQRFSRCSSLLVPWALLIFSSKCFTVIEVKTWLIGTGLVITIYTTLFICTTITSTTHRQMRSHKEPCLIHLCYMLWGKTTLSFLFCKMQCFKTAENVIISFQFLLGSDRLIFERTWDFLSLVFQTLFQSFKGVGGPALDIKMKYEMQKLDSAQSGGAPFDKFF